MCTNLGIVVSTPPITPHTLHSSTPDVGDQSGSTRSRKCQTQFSTFHVNSPHNVHTNQNGWLLSLYAQFMPLCTLLHLSSILGHKVIMRRQDHKGCFTRREKDVSYPLNPLNQPIVNSLYRIVFLTEGSNTAQFNKSINSQYAHHKQV